MKKNLTTTLVVVLLLFGFVTQTVYAGLTETQVQVVIELLRAFGTTQSVVNTLQNAL